MRPSTGSGTGSVRPSVPGSGPVDDLEREDDGRIVGAVRQRHRRAPDLERLQTGVERRAAAGSARHVLRDRRILDLRGPDGRIDGDEVHHVVEADGDGAAVLIDELHDDGCDHTGLARGALTGGRIRATGAGTRAEHGADDRDHGQPTGRTAHGGPLST
ncbi:hypothetical protein PLANTIT3_10078 [Plantibacter sp. T3]|nr:hypothetical protein PLANTIT3_10078 [Plantibacter sp. T3]